MIVEECNVQVSHGACTSWWQAALKVCVGRRTMATHREGRAVHHQSVPSVAVSPSVSGHPYSSSPVFYVVAREAGVTHAVRGLFLVCPVPICMTITTVGAIPYFSVSSHVTQLQQKQANKK